MSYLESAEHSTITKARALHELARHRVNTPEDISDFYESLGDREAYDAQEVLHFIGY